MTRRVPPWTSARWCVFVEKVVTPPPPRGTGTVGDNLRGWWHRHPIAALVLYMAVLWTVPHYFGVLLAEVLFWRP